MKQEKLTFVGQDGLAIPSTLITQAQTSRRLAVLFPGFTYRSSMPALYYPRQFFVARGYDVLSIDYTYDQSADFTALSEEDKIAWVGADARAAMALALALGRYEHFTLVGKSLGTAAMAAVAPDEPRLATADLVWLTPGFKTYGVADGMGRCPQRSMIVIGTDDPHYEEHQIAAARARGSEVVLLPGLDHGLERSGDVPASLTAMREIIERLSAWLDASPVSG
jgi:hypothetical protein